LGENFFVENSVLRKRFEDGLNLRFKRRPLLAEYCR
jgi:hypothetical protein